MVRSFLEFEQSEWWILLLLIASALLSYALYQKKNVPWNTAQNRILLGLRTLAIFFLLLLFLSPSIKRVISRVEPPVIGLAIDNSQSVTARNSDSLYITGAIEDLQEAFRQEDFLIELSNLDKKDSMLFESKTTNISSLLSQVSEQTKNKNHVATVLLSDGIYNRGASPLYKNYIRPIFTLGMGDTIPPKDISISRVRYNRVSYKGSETPIRIEISQEGYTGTRVNVQLSENGRSLEEKTMILNTSIQDLEFLLDNEEEGLRHLVISITKQRDESSQENNQSDVFMEVIDGSQKVLIVASSPHPDIKAIRATLEETDSYETSLYIPALGDDAPTEIFDVIIYHGAFNSRINYTPKENPGTWYIVNTQSNMRILNETISYLRISKKGGQPDKVTGSFNKSFSKFKIENTEIFENYPPIQVPYANYSVTGSAEILMYQRLGSVTTNSPLMVVYDDGSNKSATLMGQDIWKWRLQEAALNESSRSFDELVTKTVQFLSVKNDKEQFRFTPRSSTFQDSSPVLFDVEVYNDIYERIYGNEVKIDITNSNGETQVYSFVDSELNSTFRAPNLPPGIYQFEAAVEIGSRSFIKKGEFLIENINIEYLDLTADHRLLRNLSSQTNGEFVHLTEYEKLISLIRERNFKPIIKSEEEFQKLAQTWWFYVLIFSLFGTEWILRRYWGGY